MCWYSAEHAGKIAEAEVGQRLVTRKVHGSTWAVQESDVQTSRPTPVCMLDRTKVLFRPAEPEHGNSPVVPESEAVFRMLTKPKRDVFQFSDGREIEANALPANLVFDVLEIPGKEEFSSILKEEHDQEASASARKSESLLQRVVALF
jgi:hypothetical protein